MFHITPEVLAIASATQLKLDKLDSNPHQYCKLAGTAVEQILLSTSPANSWNAWMQVITELDAATLLVLASPLVRDLATRLDQQWQAA